MTTFPPGFATYIANLGVKDDTDDFVVIAADHSVTAAGVFTQSRFASPSVRTSRSHLADGRARAMAIVSKNANVANGSDGDADNAAVVQAVADRLGCEANDILIASTGVIGRRYPLADMLAGIAALPMNPVSTDAADTAAAGIMTTDTVPKVAMSTIAGAEATVVGIAKGVGMIEPDMATMIAVLLTDAQIETEDLDRRFREVVNRTFNCVSVDTDTSTSDTAVILANGTAGPVDLDAFEQAMFDVAVDLTKAIARDGEGASTLIEVHVDASRDAAQAQRVAKSIVNSPLVKTAVHGAYPNWGRVAMAVGKGQDDTDIDPERVVIRFGGQELYPTRVGEEGLDALTDYLRGDKVLIHVGLDTGTADATVWGCDLTDGYVRINADYTT
ncbi:bifunctional glutamate N-acetyltransferase/amino-acid acetyltransferase ArgJ [soil metagenome]